MSDVRMRRGEDYVHGGPATNGGADTPSAMDSATVANPGMTSGNGGNPLAGLAATSGGKFAAARPVTRPAGRVMPSHRDAVFRRLLAIADLAAAAGGLAIVGLITGRGVRGASLASLPLIVIIAKIAGRYDHDELVLRKSTIDEIPALFGMAAAYALAWSLVAFFAGIHVELRGADVGALWATTAALLILGRACARAVAQLSAPPERALIVGTSDARTTLAHSLACDPGAHVELVGFLALDHEGSDDAERSSPGGHPAGLGHLETVVRDLQVERVFVIPTGADSEKLNLEL